ncbi:MAG TPA: hypothetical protein VGP08_18245 [Pyrinomonadaceae bacterium]|jgi:hypothetical protein|nr:hypothetical protein [Pyrinomonadaceae bacterium]
MLELFRFFRLGIVNLVGVTLPGLLTIFFFGVGFIWPLLIFVFDLNQRFAGVEQAAAWEIIGSLYSSNKGIITSLIIILSYIIGYIIRLSTPDELDRISAKNVLKKMGEELAPETKEALKKIPITSDNYDATESFSLERAPEEIDEGLSREAIVAAKLDSWPYRGENTNKFPYYYFKQYLTSRGLAELAELVKWGHPSSESEANTFKRSKTMVNLMKLEVGLRSSELSSVIESNEAHVRLLFGTWQAITTSQRFVMGGILISSLEFLASFVPARYPSPFYPLYILSILTGCIIFAGITWAKNRIENLFHYQRVRELTHIVGCVHYVNKYKMLVDNQHPAAKSNLEDKPEPQNSEGRPNNSFSRTRN